MSEERTNCLEPSGSVLVNWLMDGSMRSAYTHADGRITLRDFKGKDARGSFTAKGTLQEVEDFISQNNKSRNSEKSKPRLNL